MRKLSRISPVLAGLSVIGFAAAPSQPVGGPQFEVASIKACREGAAAAATKGGGKASASPGTLRIDCSTLKELIRGAYVLFANGHVNPTSRIPVEGGPAWIDSERYQIDAKAGGPPGQGMMRGPMLQALLVDRFKLKIHRESREVPGYALIVAKGGPRLHPFHDDSCTPLDLRILEQFPPAPFPELPPGRKYCGGIDPNDGKPWTAMLDTMKGEILTVESRAMSIDNFIRFSLARRVDRPVVNQTGISGLFDFHLEYAPETPTDASTPADPTGPSLFSALQQQLGLKLEPHKGTSEFFVIDHVERPTKN